MRLTGRPWEAGSVQACIRRGVIVRVRLRPEMSDDPDYAELGVGDPLPRPREAVVPPAKLRDYALSSGHPMGGSKARVFAAALGFVKDDWESLRDELLQALPGARIGHVRVSPYGVTYGLALPVRGPNGREASVMTAWRLREGVPYLVTAYVDLDALRE